MQVKLYAQSFLTYFLSSGRVDVEKAIDDYARFLKSAFEVRPSEFRQAVKKLMQQ